MKTITPPSLGKEGQHGFVLIQKGHLNIWYQYSTGLTVIQLNRPSNRQITSVAALVRRDQLRIWQRILLRICVHVGTYEDTHACKVLFIRSVSAKIDEASNISNPSWNNTIFSKEIIQLLFLSNYPKMQEQKVTAFVIFGYVLMIKSSKNMHFVSLTTTQLQKYWAV